MVVAEFTLYPKSSLMATSFLPPVTCLVQEVQVQFFREAKALQPGSAWSYMEGRDVAVCAFHSDVLPAHGRGGGALC